MTDEVGTDRTASTDFASDSASEPGLEGRVAESSGGRKRVFRGRVTGVALVVTLLAAGLVLPPLVNIGRYQRQITALMARSLGRPVHLSGVELRLLPTPGFVLHDLSVSEDPSFGAEPILSARTVVASVRLWSLWRGRLEVSRVSVDEASLNLVRSPQGRWNLESVLMGAAEHPLAGSSASSGGSAAGKGVHFPYLEVTNSRVNLKNGLEKSPFSIVDTDLSLWQDEPGAWRVRLRGQPMRTDMEISSADTGEVRMEASLRAATQLRAMPLKLQMEWRDAQLGQLSRLLLGSDAGWRGDLTADIEVQGTPEAAVTKARLRATGVRRTEFTPETPLDFDANCGFRYEHPQNALRDVDCATAIGDGRLHLKGELPGRGGAAEGMLEVSKVPVQAALDLFRTVRSDFAPGMSAEGLMNGSLSYKAAEAAGPGTGGSLPGRRAGLRGGSRSVSGRAGRAAEPGSDLTGSLMITGAVLKGGKLSERLTLPSVVLTPTEIPDAGSSAGLAGGRTGLGTRFSIPLGGSGAGVAVPEGILVRFGVDARGYSLGVGGQVGIARLRELAYAFGLPQTDAADGFAAGTADLDLAAAGPWILPMDLITPAEQAARGDSLGGSMRVHHAQWQAGYLAGAVDLPQATVGLSPAGVRFDSEFAYPAAKAAGAAPVAGSVTVTAPLACSGECTPLVELRFAALDAGALQAALLGVPAKKTLLSPLMDRMRSTERPRWPAVAVDAQAEALTLGAVTLRKPVVRLRFKGGEVVLEKWQAGLLGGEASGSGSFGWGSVDSERVPEYVLKGDFSRVSAASLGALLGERWSGQPIGGSGSVRLSGLTDKELAASAVGEFSFDWASGTVSAAEPLQDHALRAAGSLRFEEWSGRVAIRSGGAELGENALVAGKRKAAVKGGLTFGGPVKLTVLPEAKRRGAN